MSEKTYVITVNIEASEERQPTFRRAMSAGLADVMRKLVDANDDE